jgi:ribosomal protein S27AE
MNPFKRPVKECPFCGPGSFKSYFPVFVQTNDNKYQGFCPKCQRVSISAKTYRKAVKNWNKHIYRFTEVEEETK